MQNQTSLQKAETLFGGRIVPVAMIDGTALDIKVAQLKMADWEKAYTLLADEMAFTAFCCFDPEGLRKTKQWLLGKPPQHEDGIMPESYELLQAAAREVNEKGFFSFATRRVAREAKENESMMAAMATLPPEAIKLAAEAGLKSTSLNSSPAPRPR